MDFVTQDNHRTQMLFQTWLTMLDQDVFQKEFEQKRIILGLCSLL